MAAYAGRRLAWVFLTLFIVSTVTFAVAFLVPADPARTIAGPKAPQETVDSIHDQLGLDRPVYVQYAGFVKNALQGDFGRSYKTQQEVLPAILDRFPMTAALAAAGVAIAVLLGVSVGVLAAAKRGTAAEGLFNVCALLGLSVPAFWLGTILLYLLAFEYPIFPLGGSYGPSSLVLPALTIGVTQAAYYSRMTRAGMLEVLGEDYVRTARAKGLKESGVIFKHAFRNAMKPILTMLGMDLGYFLGGLLVVEQVFGWPGIGTQAWQAVGNQDVPMIMGTVLFASLLIVLSNLIIDLIYPLVDPLVTYD
jgi:peptide/nickel transport system permease protein